MTEPCSEDGARTSQCPDCGGPIVHGMPYGGSYCDDCGVKIQDANGEIVHEEYGGGDDAE